MARSPLAASCRYWDKKPGYIAQEIRANLARESDWAFLARHCKHTDKRGQRGEMCCGVRRHLWARPDHAK
jgi:hypothetical protein